MIVQSNENCWEIRIPTLLEKQISPLGAISPRRRPNIGKFHDFISRFAGFSTTLTEFPFERVNYR